jgi:hypothetical protein
MSTAQGLDPVAYGDDDIKGIIDNRLIGMSNLQNMHIAFFAQFAFIEYITDMAADNAYIPLKELRHLGL